MATKKPTTFNRASLLAAVASSALLSPERVPLPELGGDVLVKRMTAGDRNDYWNLLKDVPDDINPQFYALIFATVDEAGQPIFADVNEFGKLNIQPDDIEFVRQLPQQIINEIITKFNQVNRLVSDADIEDVDKEDEDLKNS